MKLPIYLMLAVAGAGAFTSCNSDSTPAAIEEFEYNNLIVSSFSLQSNDSVLSGLDSVFFSVDLDKALIFNADSLPKGTRIDRLQVTIGLPTIKEANITFRTAEGKDSTMNYLTNPNDSVDFSNGPVVLHLLSYDGEVERDYRIQVNVHEMDPDSLYWNQSAVRNLPTSLRSVTDQRTIEHNGKILVTTTDGTSYSMAVSDNPYMSDSWNITGATMPAGAQLATLTSLGTKLYVTDGTTLWESTDMANSWTATSASISYIYGGYQNLLLGVRRDSDGNYWHTTYPATTESRVDDDCPVSGTSLPLLFSTEWASTPTMLIIGGRKASGELTGDTWGYDNGTWARISRAPIPAGEGMVFFPYFTFRTSSGWKVTEYSTLFAVADGKTYISRNRGINWNIGDASVQMPAEMPKLVNAQAIVVDQQLTVSRSASDAGSAWREVPSMPLPSWLTIETYGSRATTPITSWQCPYIYVFGGQNADGTLSDSVWRGVINRLSFKPLQ